MISPADMLVAQKINVGSADDENTMTRVLQRLLLDSNNGGTDSIATIRTKLSDYRNGKGVESSADRRVFDSMVNFYSTKGNLAGVEHPYMHRSHGAVQNSIEFDDITGVNNATRGRHDMSIIVSRSPFVTPMVRDARKVEVFLNFVPSIVISRCVPYVELEFSFDRAFTANTNNVLATTGMLKFLLGAQDVSNDAPNRAMNDARTSTVKDTRTTSKTPDDRQITTAGMELFTAPQTLINMDPIQPGARYAEVLDPTRPFASLENVSINVAPTAGIMSYKHATAVIKLHDRSRLAELADLIQPTTYTRTTVWLTYGWRHPYEPNSDAQGAETYADFINDNMLVKEAYGVKNSSFSFDAVGQVTITLELFTKSVSELRDVKVNESGFKALTRDIMSLAEEIGRLRRKYNLDPPQGLNKEIRGFMILDNAENGSFPSYSVKETQEAINGLRQTLADSGTIPKGAADPLIDALNKLYKPGKGKDSFAFKERTAELASSYVKAKFNQLRTGPDPFIIFPEKNDKMKAETSSKDDHPLLNEIARYNASDIGSDLKKEFQRTCVSFGKLFSVFMAEALFSVDTVDEFQVCFYQLNDLAGKAASTNIAEFPIDVPVFLRQFQEVIEQKQSEAMTVEEFIKLVIDAQINDVRAIPYGFKSANVFKPWDVKKRDIDFISNKTQQYETLLSSVNKGRGTFQMPQIEVYIEATHERINSTGAVDLLQYHESSGKTARKIVRIHVYDKTANPYKSAATILKSDSHTGATSYYQTEGEPWVKKHTENAMQVTKNFFKDVWSSWTATGDTGISVFGGELYKNVNATRIKHMVSKLVPTIVYGMNASMVLEATVATKQDSNLTAAQLLGLNAGRSTVATPSGGSEGGLPLKVIPAALTLRTWGCPLLNYSQLFFIDFNTGTTIDNIYGISGLTHVIAPGKFDSSLTMAFYDAYGRYEAAPMVVESMKLAIQGLD